LSQQNAQEDSHTVQEFAEQFVETLQPREERYETRLGDDFFVCTWPNGIKTWLYVYEVDGYRRRRTLGTYPELSLTDAREALFAARKLQQAEQELIDRGLGDTILRTGNASERVARADDRASAARTPFGIRVARTLGTAAVGAALAIGGMFGYGTLTTRPGAVPLTRTPTAAAATVNIARDDTREERRPTGDAEPARAPGERADDAPTGRTEPDASGPDVDQPPDQALANQPANGQAEGEAPAPPPNDKLLQLQASLAGTVSRSMLADSVANGEPYGELPDVILLDPTESQTVYFFTEVRGMKNQPMQHRWLHGQEVVQTVDLRTGSSWRYPLSSSFRLSALNSTGRWTVQLLDAEGNLREDTFFLVEVRREN
jgi:hypothetical protein